MSCPSRPYTILSCSISLDGFLDGGTPERLVLSNAADLERVDAVRAECDAILVGAATVRNDNPRLLVRRPALRSGRLTRGLPESPMKVTLTERVRLDPASNFFTTGDSEKLVYCASPTLLLARRSQDLHERGVRRLMVEGGGRVHTQFLTADVADELQLVVAPFFVGNSRAHRFVGDGRFPWHTGHRARLAETRQLGDVVLLRYAMSDRFEDA
jgi:riboflavin-specific deaminase-like protein